MKRKKEERDCVRNVVDLGLAVSETKPATSSIHCSIIHLSLMIFSSMGSL